MKINSIYSSIPDNISEELIEELVTSKSVRIERIVSEGHASPKNFWYDQPENEWVLVLEGSAGILLERKNDPVILQKGDYLNIPAHKKHRIMWTEKSRKTIWLAIFYK